MDLSATKQFEETKRWTAYDPVQRWRHIQETIAWAESNLPPEQRRNRPRVRKIIDAPLAAERRT